MAMTAMEASTEACLLVLLNSCGTQMDRCRPGECSAWEWTADPDPRRDGERVGYCALAGKPTSRDERISGKPGKH
jgi:hypothetical protein